MVYHGAGYMDTYFSILFFFRILSILTQKKKKKKILKKLTVMYIQKNLFLHVLNNKMGYIKSILSYDK